MIEQATMILRGSLGSATFAGLWAEGRTLSAEAAAREARAVKLPDTAAGDGLTRREREVLRLLVEGESDSAIAEQLFISTRTASKHVAVILEKLGAPNRTAAATIAHRRGLV
jgi:DNA-binding NarL/FixJ family response regulator